MGQEKISLDQGLMIKKIEEIVKWMQKYEAKREEPFDHDKKTTVTAISKSEGYCHALSTYLLNNNQLKLVG